MKARRQRLILEIIRQQVIETQEELAEALRAAGFPVTQATVSRDIRELGLVKVPGEGNIFRYAAPGETPPLRRDERLKRLLRSSVQFMDFSENLVVVKTLPGEAQGVASAIDQASWPEVIGTVAGDDTILVIVKPKKLVTTVLQRLNELARG
ncbi:arginine repressor [Desulfofundulus thermosubterraneus]|uniref:Arginine repressor n=1 Tax=Desulfofundulus thermosubterraneus DSM 16057 TaxID=1121432 RepID=A0A1M6I6K6_9FIRM|nr:arginine repressor [Desulfofundulus thermosubterraneus]SHJ30067.1 transcriptional regulator, ArgR family [Desulfofundulus thermosubterraneus DSM 16057]